METINKLRQLIKQEQSNKKENKIAPAHVTLLFVVDKIKASKEDIMAAAKKTRTIRSNKDRSYN